MEHLENLNKGLENKIISLQQRIDKTVKKKIFLCRNLILFFYLNIFCFQAVERETFKKEASVLPQLKSTLDSANLNLEQARKRILELEIEVKNLRDQLSTFEQDAFQSRQIAENVLFFENFVFLLCNEDFLGFLKEMVALNEAKTKLNDELAATLEKLSEVERHLEQGEVY